MVEFSREASCSRLADSRLAANREKQNSAPLEQAGELRHRAARFGGFTLSELPEQQNDRPALGPLVHRVECATIVPKSETPDRPRAKVDDQFERRLDFGCFS